MPYINDVLAANERKNTEAKYVPSKGHSSRFRFDPDAVGELLKSRIIGQPELHEAICDMLHVVRADFGGEGRPLAVFLFLGSTGVGKTETVRVLSEAILGSVDELCRIDMNTLAQEHYAAAITGAPPGYVGSKENHSLFDFEKVEGSYGKPGIVLFDEIEKADKQVARTLLNVLDSGVLELSSGNRRLSFANAMIFMTSNEGAGELQRYREKFDTGWRKWVGKKLSKVKEREILNRALRAKFDPEFLNRIDRVVHFEPLGESFLDQILEVELEMLEKRLSKFQVGLEVDEAAREFLTQGHDTRYGARHLRRRIRQHLEPKLARVLNGDGGVKVLRVGCEGEALVVSYG